MNTDNEERIIQESAKQALDQSLYSIDKNTQDRLRDTRMQALNLASKPSNWQTLFKPFPIMTALAFSFVLIIALPQWQSSPALNNTNLLAQEQAFDDLLLLSEIDDDTLEVLDELEFALWLSEEMDTLSEGSEFEEQASNTNIHQSMGNAQFASTLPTVVSCFYA